MSLDCWALGCPGSGNLLFQRRMSSFLKEPTASPRGDHESLRGDLLSLRGDHKPDRPVTHSSPLSMWLSVLLFFLPPLKPRCQGKVMGFVGGGGNIVIATALPTSSLVYCIVNIKRFIYFLYHIFYGCLRLRFLDVGTNPDLRVLYLLSAEDSVVMCWAWPGTLVT